MDMTFTMLLPESATFLPYFSAQLIICCTRLMFDANVAMMSRFLFAYARAKSASKLAFTVCSVCVYPGRAAFVESAISSKTPS